MKNDVVQQILKLGLDDWVPLVDVVNAVRQSVDTDEEGRVRTKTLMLLADLSRGGWVRIGEVSDGGFFEFQDSLDEVLDDVEHAWTGKQEPGWWFLCWIENTDEGDRRARRDGPG